MDHVGKLVMLETSRKMHSLGQLARMIMIVQPLVEVEETQPAALSNNYFVMKVSRSEIEICQLLVIMMHDEEKVIVLLGVTF